MTTFHALLIGAGLMIAAGVIMAARRVVSGPLLAVVILVALISSAASASRATQRHAGTGTVVSRGFPKPYHFHWRDFEGRGENRGWSATYFGANTAVHLGAISLVAAVVARRRRERSNSSATMPAKMLIIRLTLGIVFLLLGVVGSLLPILQGWIFFLLAFLTLFPQNRMSQKIMSKAEQKLPRVHKLLCRLGIGHQHPRDTMRVE